MKRLVPCIAVCGLLSLAASNAGAQQLFHIFPQFVDGRSADGTYYRSIVSILPWSPYSSPECELVLYGMNARFDTGASGYYFTTNVPAGTGLSAPTSGTQPLETGYATLWCSDYVFANVIYSFYTPNNIKLGEATVTSAPEYYETRMVIDTRDGALPAIAIANNTDFRRTYTIRLTSGGRTRSAWVTVPARRNLARFVHDILPIPDAAVGVLSVQSNDYSYFSMTGFRLTGGIFTAVPVGQ